MMTIRMIGAAVALWATCGLAVAAPSAGPPDTIFFNGKIATFDAAGTTAEAVAIKDGKFSRVGRSDAIRKLAGPATRVVDLGGRTVLPGLIDAHTHPMEAMMMKETWVDARYPGVPSVKAALARIADWAQTTPKGEWIFAAAVSASENKFEEKRLPTRAELDAAAPDNPTILANGTHMAIANSAALTKLGIGKGASRLPHGGSVLVDASGEPTGVLTDAQADVPTTPTLVQLEKYYAHDIQAFWNQHGFTSLLAITPAAALPVLQKMAAAKVQPTIRYTTSVWSSANGEDMPSDLRAYRMPAGADPAWYRFGGIKVWIDGENDCRTGYMHEPYVGRLDTDPPGGRGTLVTPLPAASHIAAIARQNGAMSMMHCSGDAAIDIALSAYEKLPPGTSAKPIRIEHFGMFQMNAAQLDRAKALKPKGLRISVQPTWLLDLARADIENMGEERARTGFRFRAMIDAGLEPAAGSDVTGIYLDNVNPFLGIYAAVTRQSDAGLFEPAQAITVTEAVRMWTIWAARSMGEADVKGSIEPGKYADMVVLSDDIFTLPKDRLRDVKPLQTIVGGNVVYQAK
jgi:predicted amidohydrolase YtcJ